MGAVVLKRKVRDYVKAGRVVDMLRAVYGDGFAVNVNKSGECLDVVIPMHVFERYSDIKGQVIEVLCRRLEKTKDERKRRIITKHLRRLAPTEEVAAACKL
ncbi:hypothetical protein [Vulcanisaeta sp. JCM 14467]|uniref:hypothetical protein n=1 Tax=Vulcanisaeta sp. JCM 14467 TaxID=1295370 RepID=UPI0006D1BD43|nr:hypothetical protein [Vulcanisaeta sp. JCM 14467]